MGVCVCVCERVYVCLRVFIDVNTRPVPPTHCFGVDVCVCVCMYVCWCVYVYM